MCGGGRTGARHSAAVSWQNGARGGSHVFVSRFRVSGAVGGRGGGAKSLTRRTVTQDDVHQLTRIDVRRGPGPLKAFCGGELTGSRVFAGMAPQVHKSAYRSSPVTEEVHCLRAGILMIGVGVLMITNQFTILASYLQQFTPDVILKRL